MQSQLPSKLVTDEDTLDTVKNLGMNRTEGKKQNEESGLDFRKCGAILRECFLR